MKDERSYKEGRTRVDEGAIRRAAGLRPAEFSRMTRLLMGTSGVAMEICLSRQEEGEP